MLWTLDAKETAFRDEVRDFLARELTPALHVAGRRCAGIFSEYAEGIQWHRILARRGWSVPHWPVEHGGTGWTPMQHYLFASELAAADAPPIAPMGTRMVAPVIIAFGTAAQQRAWLPGIRSGDDYWCQGYSEPQSGSDLASLQCKAVRDGDDYVLNGTKIWTTHAQFANRMFCLVRTASGGRPQQGISFLCLDLPQPGITIRPIISISGDHELNQVFFDDVRVPASGLIGEENQGWAVAKYLLAHERGSAWAPLLRARLQRLRGTADTAFAAAGAAADDEARETALALARLDCDIDALEATELQSLRSQARGEPPGIRPSIGKLLGSELRQRLTELGVEVGGAHGAVALPLDDGLAGALPVPEESVYAMSAYLNDRAASIYAGTNEVQRNIIAAHLLGAEVPATGPLPESDSREVLGMLRDSLARYLDDHHDFAQRRQALARANAAPPAFWRGLARDLDLLGAALPESHGGLGLGLAAHLALMPVLGAALATEPYLSTLVLGAGLLQRHPGTRSDALLRRVATGQAVLAFAHDEPHGRHARDAVRTRLARQPDGGLVLQGRKAVVQAAPWADALIVSARGSGGGLSLVLVPADAPGVRLRTYPTRDGGRAADIAFDAVHLPADALLGTDGAALPQIERALDEATLAVCAESTGLLRRLMRDTLAHVRQRKQFGVPISSFQALQHRLADMHLALEQAEALTLAVGEALAGELSASARARAVSSAKVAVARACRAVGQGAVQLHGGMGMTEELAVGHGVRRATLIESQFGPLSWHLRRVAQIVRDGAATAGRD